MLVRALAGSLDGAVGAVASTASAEKRAVCPAALTAGTGVDECLRPHSARQGMRPRLPGNDGAVRGRGNDRSVPRIEELGLCLYARIPAFRTASGELLDPHNTLSVRCVRLQVLRALHRRRLTRTQVHRGALPPGQSSRWWLAKPATPVAATVNGPWSAQVRQHAPLQASLDVGPIDPTGSDPQPSQRACLAWTSPARAHRRRASRYWPPDIN